MRAPLRKLYGLGCELLRFLDAFFDRPNHVESGLRQTLSAPLSNSEPIVIFERAVFRACSMRAGKTAQAAKNSQGTGNKSARRQVLSVATAQSRAGQRRNIRKRARAYQFHRRDRRQPCCL